MTKPDASPWSPEFSGNKSGDIKAETFTMPLADNDIQFLQKKRNKAFKVTRFFTIAFMLGGILWAWGSGYYEPLYICSGAIIITVGIWWLLKKSYKKEFDANKKLIYRGKVRKSTYTSGSGKSKTTTYVVRIGDSTLENMDLYSSFADDDEVEVHLSSVKKIILKKEILKGTGNLEYNEVLKKVEFPQDLKGETYLEDDETVCLNNRLKKNTRIFMYFLVVFPLTYVGLEWFFWYVDLFNWNSKQYFVIPIFASLGFIYLLVYYFAIYKVSLDIKIGKKDILQTRLIDRESRTYSNNKPDYILRTSKKKDYYVSHSGYTMFQNQEQIEIQRTWARKKLILIKSLDVNNKIYKSEKFFKDL
ncbi:MAG: hypothetical protein U0W24_09675 [Bacteroidales bacterium]